MRNVFHRGRFENQKYANLYMKKRVKISSMLNTCMSFEWLFVVCLKRKIERKEKKSLLWIESVTRSCWYDEYGGNCLGKFIYPNVTFYNGDKFFIQTAFRSYSQFHSFSFFLLRNDDMRQKKKKTMCDGTIQAVYGIAAYAYAHQCRYQIDAIHKQEYERSQFNFHLSISLNMNIYNGMKVIIMLEMFVTRFGTNA